MKDSQISNLLRILLPTSLPKVKSMNAEFVPILQENVECPVCYMIAEDLLKLNLCDHYACRSCWTRFVCVQIDNFCMGQLTCVVCTKPLPPNLVSHLLSTAISQQQSIDNDNNADGARCEAYYSRTLRVFDDFQIRQALSSEQDMRWCPNGCGYGLIARSFYKCPQIACAHPNCNGSPFCYHCQRPWLNTTLDNSTDALANMVHNCPVLGKSNRSSTVGLNGLRNLLRKQQPLPQQQQTSVVVNANHTNFVVQGSNGPATSNSVFPDAADSPNSICQNGQSALEVEQQISSISNIEQNCASNKTTFILKSCPKCKTLIQKCNDGSCNYMVCSLCGHEFCWLCLRGISVEHYFSFSGCTLYGRRRWSKTRQITFVICLMFLMPIIIPFCVVLGVPAVTISLTTLVARSTHDSLLSKNRCSRVFATLGSALIAGLLLCAPVSVAFALFIPIALGFVYLYLPAKLIYICIVRSDSNQGDNLDVEKAELYEHTENEKIPPSSNSPDFDALCVTYEADAIAPD